MILILDNYDSFTYNLYQAVAAVDPDVTVVRNDKITVAEIKALNPTGIIISPGPGRPEKAGIGIALIKTLGKDIPMLGVCLGHQMMTVAFGGKVELAERAIHGKDEMIFHHRQGLYDNMPLPFKAGRYHSLIALKQDLPDCMVVEAESGEGMVMGVRHKEYPLYGVQFHPESILTPKGDTLIQNFLTLCQQHHAAVQKKRVDA